MDAYTPLAAGLILAGMAYLVARLFLSRPDAPRPDEPAPTDPLAGDLAAALPVTSATGRELQQLLYMAGYYRPGALKEYLAVRATLVVGCLVLTGLFGMLADPAGIPAVVLWGAVASAVAYSLPRVILGARATARAKRLTRSLPTAIDVLALCLTAGQNLVGGLEQTSAELADSNPDLSEELRIVHQHAAMHSLERAMSHWADRIELPEVRTLALLLIQSDRLGTDMVNTLLDLADSQRTQIRQRAEAAANRTNFWMLLPTLFCLWIASAIVLVGPAYLEFFQYRQSQMKSLMTNVRGSVESANPTPQTPPAGTAAAEVAPSR